MQQRLEESVTSGEGKKKNIRRKQEWNGGTKKDTSETQILFSSASVTT